jgi:hypothetical protein
MSNAALFVLPTVVEVVVEMGNAQLSLMNRLTARLYGVKIMIFAIASKIPLAR